MTSRTQDDDVEYDSFDDRLLGGLFPACKGSRRPERRNEGSTPTRRDFHPSWRPRAMEVSDLGLWADLR